MQRDWSFLVHLLYFVEGGKKSPVPKKGDKGGKDKKGAAAVETADDDFVPPPPPLEVSHNLTRPLRLRSVIVLPTPTARGQ